MTLLTKDDNLNKETEDKNMEENIIIQSEEAQEPNKENEDLNKNEIIGQTIVNRQNIDDEKKEPENDNNNEDINVMNAQTILMDNKEPEKNNEDLDKDKIIGEVIVSGSNEPKKEDEIQNESNNSEFNIINSKKVLRAKKKDKKDNNKDNIEIEKNLVAGLNKNDNNEENNIDSQMIVSAHSIKDEDNKNINNSNEDLYPYGLTRMRKMTQAKKLIKGKFKIRRAIFLKVEKEN